VGSIASEGARYFQKFPCRRSQPLFVGLSRAAGAYLLCQFDYIYHLAVPLIQTYRSNRITCILNRIIEDSSSIPHCCRLCHAPTAEQLARPQFTDLMKEIPMEMLIQPRQRNRCHCYFQISELYYQASLGIFMEIICSPECCPATAAKTTR
jgi:hypothetical protein